MIKNKNKIFLFIVLSSAILLMPIISSSKITDFNSSNIATLQNKNNNNPTNKRFIFNKWNISNKSVCFRKSNLIAFTFKKNSVITKNYSFKYFYYDGLHKLNNNSISKKNANIKTDFVSFLLLNKTQIIVKGFDPINFVWSKNVNLSILSELTYFAKTQFIISPQTINDDNVNVDLVLKTTTYTGKTNEVVIGSYFKTKNCLSGSDIAGITVGTIAGVAIVIAINSCFNHNNLLC